MPARDSMQLGEITQIAQKLGGRLTSLCNCRSTGDEEALTLGNQSLRGRDAR